MTDVTPPVVNTTLAPVPSGPETPSQSITPFWKDKALYVTILGLFTPFLSRWLGIELDPVKVAGYVVLLVSFVIAHKAKSALVLMAEIKARAVQTVAANPATTPTTAAAALNSLFKP